MIQVDSPSWPGLVTIWLADHSTCAHNTVYQTEWSATLDCPLSLHLHPQHHRPQLLLRDLSSPEALWWLSNCWMHQWGWVQDYCGQLCHMVWAEPPTAQCDKDPGLVVDMRGTKVLLTPVSIQGVSVDMYRIIWSILTINWTGIYNTNVLYRKGQSLYFLR